jgi:predicted dehydrogenase
LTAQLRAFVGSVRDRDHPVVSARDALSALRTALRVIEAMPDVSKLV